MTRGSPFIAASCVETGLYAWLPLMGSLKMAENCEKFANASQLQLAAKSGRLRLNRK
jgi:hypothetical protein